MYPLKDFVSRSEFYHKEKAKQAAANLIDIWNNYLCGNVWYVAIYQNDEIIDCCGNIYDYNYALQDAKSQIDNYKS